MTDLEAQLAQVRDLMARDGYAVDDMTNDEIAYWATVFARLWLERGNSDG